MKYQKNTFADWNKLFDDVVTDDVSPVLNYNLEVGVDYWFRLKEYRVEFMPELLLGLKTETNVGASSMGVTYYGLNFNTNLYVFDLKGDCDCPTFSKQGPSLEKGVFVYLSPGILYNTVGLHTIDTDEQLFVSSSIVPRLGIGAGIDIGLSDLITITPMVGYNLVFGTSWEGFRFIDSSLEDSVSTSWNQLQFQIRFGFRPDYTRNNRRR